MLVLDGTELVNVELNVIQACPIATAQSQEKWQNRLAESV